MFRFANPEFLFLLLLLPAVGYYQWRRRHKLTGRVKFSTLKYMKNIPVSWRQRIRKNMYLFRLAIIGLIILGLARPQSGTRKQEITTEGIDIMMVMDVSSSMLAEDFKPKNRIEAAKDVAEEFIHGRTNDRIGLVIFAGEAFTQCPLTLDYGVLTELIDKVQVAPRDWDGTAIGNGIATAVMRLKDSKARSKVIILLTDGRNNAGEINPLTAAQVAQTFDIRVYTIGAGTRGTALYPIDDPIFGRSYRSLPVEIDEDLLRKVAAQTNGQYFRATDTEKLRQIYQEINEMEKTKIEVKEFTKYKELFVNYAGAGLALLLLELLLLNTWLRKLP
ncbi:MAG: VWA domain-containing protein [Calditrichota bacterium]